MRKFLLIVFLLGVNSNASTNVWLTVDYLQCLFPDNKSVRYESPCLDVGPGQTFETFPILESKRAIICGKSISLPCNGICWVDRDLIKVITNVTKCDNTSHVAVCARLLMENTITIEK